MDPEPLVEKAIEDGQKLVDELIRRGFDVSAAAWLRPTFNGKWRFYVVSPTVDADGITQAYQRLHKAIYAAPPTATSSIGPLQIRLVGASQPLGHDILASLSMTPPNPGPVRWMGIQLGDLSIDGAYLYPVFAPTP